MDRNYVRISSETYQRLLTHLLAYSVTDSQAQELLEKLEKEVKSASQLASGAYLVDGNNQAKYRIN
jgi:hypothetical protein